MKLPLFSLLLSALTCSVFIPDVWADAQILPVPPQATKRVATVQVRVAPDHPDWTYKLGEPARFRVILTADNVPFSAPITYSIGPEQMPARTQLAELSADGLTLEAGTLKAPGFIHCTVETKVAGHSYKGGASAAFSPELIKPTQSEPSDFDVFWRANLEELATVPMEPVMTLMPEACTSLVNVYHVSFRGIGNSWQAPARIYGILCEPKAPGTYPAILRVPGAGVRPYFGDKDLAQRGVITLEIGVHGIPLNQSKETYDVLLGGALNEYWFFNADNRQKYYYRRVVLGCIRANDFLASRKSWNGKDLIVAGASQGGFLSIATAALDPRVTGLCVTHPAMCDLTGPLHGRAGGWPHPFRSWGAEAPALATPAVISTLAYYDTVNFARRVKVPGYYNWGYNDDVCPPTSSYAAFNVITAPKELDLTLELAHSYTQEQYDAITAWIVQFLGLK
jgi:cephalosporin-C deacetylase-like acetyl esterase